MNVPKARKLPSGSRNVKMRLGVRSLSVMRSSEKVCIREEASAEEVRRL